MTMMISKFYRLIQSRLLWGAILVMIVFSFVIWGMVWPSGRGENATMNSAGRLDGELVSHGEFRAAHVMASLSIALNLGNELHALPNYQDLLRNMAWQRLAVMRQIKKIGISVSDEDVAASIRANFADDHGHFSREFYNAFLVQRIQPLGYHMGAFEEYLRNEIAIQKLGNLIGRQAYVTPLEVRQTFNTLLDEHRVEYVQLTAADFEKDVKVTAAQAKAFFEEDPARFTLPEEREILVSTFPMADFLDENAEVSEDDVLDYYELNIDDYTSLEETEDGETRTVVADLEEVRGDIEAALRRADALQQAQEAATDLVVKAMPDRDGGIPDFQQVAQTLGRPARPLDPFTVDQIPIEDGGRELTLAAFGLEEDTYDRVSMPFAGQDNVYVLYLVKIRPAREPEYKEVKKEVMAAAREKAVADAMLARAGEIREKAAAALAANGSFAAVAKEFGLEVISPDPFTGLSGANNEDPSLLALVRQVGSYNPGEITEPIGLADNLLVAHVIERATAEEEAFDAYREEIAASIRQSRARNLFQDWQTALISPNRFEDFQRMTYDEDDDETADEDESI